MNAHGLTREQVDALQLELDSIRDEYRAKLGEADLRYIRRVIATKRWLEIGGRGLLMFSFSPLWPLMWLAGTLMLTVAKILGVMEIGHNVLHGQYDWTGDPALDSRSFEWDTMVTSANWRHSHNVIHHNHTNIIGRDRDLGYGVLRVADGQAWDNHYLKQKRLYVIMLLTFELGIGIYDAEMDSLREKRITWAEFMARLAPFRSKLRRYLFRDYIMFPVLALTTGNALSVLLGNLAANMLMQAWTNIIIFCGHFTRDVTMFTEEQTANETRGDWYARQILGSSNIEGPQWVYTLSGHLSHQIEHHLFPDIPSRHYPAIALRVREICGRYGLHYNCASLLTQYGSVLQRIIRLSRPPRDGDAGLQPGLAT